MHFDDKIQDTWYIMDQYIMIIHVSITIYYNVVTGAGFLIKISAVSAYNSSKLVVDRTWPSSSRASSQRCHLVSCETSGQPRRGLKSLRKRNANGARCISTRESVSPKKKGPCSSAALARAVRCDWRVSMRVCWRVRSWFWRRV